MEKIQVVLFDVGGVLLTNGWDHEERATVLKHFLVDPAAYQQRHEPADDEWEKGLITAEQFLKRTVFFEHRSFTAAEFLDRMKAQSRLLDHGAMGVLSKLRAAGDVKLAILNNEGRELNDYRIAKFGLTQYFDAFLSSCYLGLRKPDQKIFRVALEVLQANAAETVFIDDREENCSAAASLGIHAIQYSDPRQLSHELSEVGVRLREAPE